MRFNQYFLKPTGNKAIRTCAVGDAKVVLKLAPCDALTVLIALAVQIFVYRPAHYPAPGPAPKSALIPVLDALSVLIAPGNVSRPVQDIAPWDALGALDVLDVLTALIVPVFVLLPVQHYAPCDVSIVPVNVSLTAQHPAPSFALDVPHVRHVHFVQGAQANYHRAIQ